MASTPLVVKQLAHQLGICEDVSDISALEQSQRYLLALPYALATLPLPAPWAMAISNQGQLVYMHKRQVYVCPHPCSSAGTQGPACLLSLIYSVTAPHTLLYWPFPVQDKPAAA